MSRKNHLGGLQKNKNDQAFSQDSNDALGLITTKVAMTILRSREQLYTQWHDKTVCVGRMATILIEEKHWNLEDKYLKICAEDIE